MSESPHFPPKESRLADKPLCRGFRYALLKAAISDGAHPLARLNLEHKAGSSAEMARAMQDLLDHSRREHP